MALEGHRDFVDDDTAITVIIDGHGLGTFDYSAIARGCW
jgi:hypothetical protein